jgi:pullulanase
MKLMRIGFLFGFLTGFLTTNAQQTNEEFPPYNGTDLGLTFSPKKFFFKIWAPTATKAQLKIFTDDVVGDAIQIIPMKKSVNGTWEISVSNNIKGKYYSFNVEHKGVWLKDVPDPYAKAVGTNGKRAMVIDLKDTNPQGWANDKRPILKNKTDAIIYELHVRDAGIATNSGIKNKGKFLGLTETGTKNNEGLSTGLDHIKDLGVTHVHLLPVFDYNSIDESKPNDVQYNWGYDPLNYNVPEGSYSTNTADGNVRIKEFKGMIKTFHSNGLSVVMDVV